METKIAMTTTKAKPVRMATGDDNKGREDEYGNKENGNEDGNEDGNDNNKGKASVDGDSNNKDCKK